MERRPPTSLPAGVPPQAQPARPGGLVLVDKPYRLSSTSIVRVVKRRLLNSGLPKSLKVGHAGTLDPLASGLMVVLVGWATRLCDRLMAWPKRYVADVDLAFWSSTDDLEGELERVEVAEAPTEQRVRDALAGMVGVVMQAPPAHSAVWIGGTRSYKLARGGHAPLPAPRPVTIHAIDVLAYEFPMLRIGVKCGKGTYIRSLARDIGRALGTGGMLDGLRRTEVGPLRVEEAYSLDRLPDPFGEELLRGVPETG